MLSVQYKVIVYEYISLTLSKAFIYTYSQKKSSVLLLLKAAEQDNLSYISV